MSEYLTLEQAQSIVVEAIEAIYAGDQQRLVAALTTGYAANATNIGFLLRVLPVTGARYLRSALAPDAPVLAMPVTDPDGPEHLWWSSRIAAAAASDDLVAVNALVDALIDRAASITDDVAAAKLMGSVVAVLTQFFVTGVETYIAQGGAR